MIRRCVWAVLLAAVALAAALVVLPARWLLNAVPSHWPVRPVDAQGTLWSGQAILALGNGPQARSLADPLVWHMSLWPTPRIDITHPWLDGPVRVSPGWQGTGLSAQTLSVPAQALAALDARLFALDPQGWITLRWPALFIPDDNGPPVGTKLLDIEWRDAAFALTSVRPVGDYVARVDQGKENTVHVQASTTKGHLLFNGNGTLGAQGLRLFEGSVTVNPASPPGIQTTLLDMLATLGPRRDNHIVLRYPATTNP
jgi:general secretion pathway protein N